MARNTVQFQKGLSEPAFEQQYGTEEQCRAAVVASRWPDGFACPACGGHEHSQVKTRGLFQCTACRRQTSPIAGTIFASTKLPLPTWFRAMYHLTQTKQGISSIELGRRLGVTQTTAWKVKHKLKQVMIERDACKPLTGRVEMDDVYLGGERSGGKRGRGAAGKTPFVAAVQTTADGKFALTGHDGWAVLWDADTGRLLQSFFGNATWGRAALSLDGKRVLTGAALWDAKTGERLRTFVSGSPLRAALSVLRHISAADRIGNTCRLFEAGKPASTLSLIGP